MSTRTSQGTVAPPEASEKESATTLDNAEDDPFLVVLEPADNPQCLPIVRRWIAVLVISSASLCVTCASSIAAFTEVGTAETFGVSHEVAVLAISLFVAGLGLGPMLAGPLSEVYGRNAIYRISFTLFLIFTFPVAFAPNISVFLLFRFFTGMCGSTFLSVAGGSVSDMFPNESVANPMAVYTISPFIGPVVGPLIGGFINQNLNWRWTFYIELCWIFGELIALLFVSISSAASIYRYVLISFQLVPETYVPVILKRKAHRLRKSTGDSRYYASLDKMDKNIFGSILYCCYKPFQLLLFDRMALLLDTWTALLIGILYLAFEAFPIIFGTNHGFNTQMVGLSFLGIGLGMLIGISTQPFWNRKYARIAEKSSGDPPPEMRLLMGQVGGVLVPIGLFSFAFTTYTHVHWIAPIIASVPFGAGVYFVFTSTFTYLVTAYRPIAASAMAANSALRSAFAAVFPLFADVMYAKLGTVGATALLAGLTTLMAPLPFIFHRVGARLRKKSPFAASY